MRLARDRKNGTQERKPIPSSNGNKIQDNDDDYFSYLLSTNSKLVSTSVISFSKLFLSFLHVRVFFGVKTAEEEVVYL